MPSVTIQESFDIEAALLAEKSQLESDILANNRVRSDMTGNRECDVDGAFKRREAVAFQLAEVKAARTCANVGAPFDSKGIYFKTILKFELKALAAFLQRMDDDRYVKPGKVPVGTKSSSRRPWDEDENEDTGERLIEYVVVVDRSTVRTKTQELRRKIRSINREANGFNATKKVELSFSGNGEAA